MLTKNKITEAELEIMNVLWKSCVPVTANEVCESLKSKKWKYTTISTLLGRLAEKGAIKYEKKGKTYYYTPIIQEKEFKTQQAKNFIEKIYDGSVKNLIASLYEDKEISEKDIEEIKELFRLF